MNLNLATALNGSVAYMLPQREQTHITEEYVSSPPALLIVDETNAVWTLGMTMYTHKHDAPRGEYSFPVLRNGDFTGEIASRIERRNRKIRIFTAAGWKVWNGRSFT